MKKILLFTIAMLFALVAKATPTITPIAGDDKGYTITINEPADFDIFNSSDKVFYTEGDGTEIKVSEIKELVIVTKNPHKLNRDKAKTLLNNCSSLDYLDLENCNVENNIFNKEGDDPNPFKNKLKTLVFPKTNGLIIQANSFGGNYNQNQDGNNTVGDTELETVIFPDNEGTYQIMEYAFGDCRELKTVSMGKGYTIPDMSGSNGQWTSQTGSGKAIFDHCINLKNVVFDNSIADLGESAFQRTYSLEYVVLPENLLHFGFTCFKASGLVTVTIPDHVSMTGNSSNQVFQYCGRLRNLFVNADNVPAGLQSIMEMNQTMNFKWKYGNGQNDQSTNDQQTCSIEDYRASNNCVSNYSDCPWEGEPYQVCIFHYPGTKTAINNYRVPFYMHYSGKHDATDTTWPNATDLSNINNGTTIDGVFYRGYGGWDQSEKDPITGQYVNDQTSSFAGWRQFLIGNNIFKEQKVFYDERIKESRWYSICLPINMTEAQFMNAYGVGAELKEFSGAVYDEEEKMIILQFDKDAIPSKIEGSSDQTKYLLKKGVPYMIHPAKIKFSKRKEVYLTLDGELEFQKTTTSGQEDYVTTDVIATFDVESDLFVNWNSVLVGQTAFSNRVAEIISSTATSLEENSVTNSLTISGSNPDNIQPADFKFKGSYLGAAVWGPVTKYIGTSPTLPKGAYYLGYDPDHGVTTPQFFQSRGIATWSPYCALITKESIGGASGAKEFDVLDIDFYGEDIVVTGIGNPTIQIPVMNTNDKVYNLNGQVVRENSKDLNGLKGIFIVGGKKVVIK